jgi:C-terminal processing protease CtpA/Prc
VRELVIDIRANEGGDGAIGLELLSYLVREPVRASADQSVTMYERIPAALTPYLDTWDKGFYDRSGQVDPIVDGPQAGRLRFRPYANKVTMITPRATRFTGKALLLVGPENSSATFSLAQLVKQTGAATLVGQPTGGNLRGLNGGQLAWVTLPHSGVAVDIPLLATSYRADTPDAGIAPDLLVERHFDRQAAGIDEEMAAALALPAR